MAVDVAGSLEMVNSAGFAMLVNSYTTGLRLMSAGRDFLGRFDLAHLAALSLACLAKQIVLKVEVEDEMETCVSHERRNS